MSHKMENQEKLKAIATSILEKANYQSTDVSGDEDEHGSVIAVIMIISTLLTLIRIIQECNKNKDKMFYANRIRDISVRRGWYTKMRINTMQNQQFQLSAQHRCTKRRQHVPQPQHACKT